ncbi:MAG: hypothetical protein IBX67_07780 [Dehalococcoidia bacterium]|nr:hypothetical protein [Dehalococcoidia bacterium]
MTDFRRGIKAGIIAAIVFLVITVILELTGISHRYWAITTAAGLDLGIGPWVAVPAMIVTRIIMRIVGGLVFGAVFAALHDHLPNGRSVVKGLVLASFLWIIGAVGVIYTTVGWPDDGMSGPMVWGTVVSLASLKKSID